MMCDCNDEVRTNLMFQMNVVALTAVSLGLASLKSRLATALSDVLKPAGCMAVQDHLIACASVVCTLQNAVYRLLSGMRKEQGQYLLQILSAACA
jgi:hypothetical protein